MVKRNTHLAKLQGGYLFPEIHKRKLKFLEKNPHADLISLGVGNTTEPLPTHIASGLIAGAKQLAHSEGYTGYAPEQGSLALRESIASVYYHNQIHPDEIFISDGAKCDIGRWQWLFGPEARIAVQDPSYPAYIDSAVIAGQTGPSIHGQYEKIAYMPCTPENGFFPHPLPQADLFYFCSPNNPTGAVATHEQLETLVSHAKKQRAIILFDAAYSSYIRDPQLPTSIYQIPGASEVAIEIQSFSKSAGFTGVRLGWSVVPKKLCYHDGYSVHADWNRLVSTLFNGASNIAQSGGLAALEPQGQLEIRQLTDFYLENSALLKKACQQLPCEIFGGDQAPYIWLRFHEKDSWELFEIFLEQAHLITTPGIGFGPSGKGCLRLSSFGHRSTIEEAARRLNQYLAPYLAGKPIAP